MRKLLFVLSALFVVGYASQVRAESSVSMYEPGQARTQQVFIGAYNNYSATISRNSPVILDVGNGTAGTTLGAYVTATATTDSIFSVGVADEDIAAGSMGRICVRGPHKVAAVNNLANQSTGVIFATSTTVGKAGVYSTSDGTVGGQLGILLNTTATTDTGDAANTFWAWINPQVHK